MANLGAKLLSTEIVGELQRKCNFAVEISGLDTNVTILTKSFPLPKSANEVIVVKMGNSETKYAGHATFEAGDMTLYDSVSLDTEKALQDWRDSVYDSRTEAIGLASSYKRDAVVTEFTPDGSISRQWKLEGVWPNAFTPGELSNDDSGVKEIQISLTWDRGYRI